LVNSNKKLFKLLEPYKIVSCYTDGGDCTFVSKDNAEYSYKTPVNLIRFVENITGEHDESLVNELNLIYDNISNDFINVVYDNKMIKRFLKRDIINDRSLTKTVFDVLYAETPVISGEKVSNGAITKTYKKIKSVRNPFEK
jgi:hypothetical protein